MQLSYDMYDIDAVGADPRHEPRVFSTSHLEGLLRIGVLLRLLACCALTNAYVIVASCVAVGVHSHGCALNNTLPIGMVTALLVVRMLDVPVRDGVRTLQPVWDLNPCRNH